MDGSFERVWEGSRHMDAIERNRLRTMAHSVRRRILGLATDGGCFLGASLSAVEIVLTLYERELHIPSHESPERDYFFLSKGHDVPALYATFVEKGWLEESRLRNHLSVQDSIYWHPNRAVPGVEFHSGSLGHLLAVAAGVALDKRLRGHEGRAVVLVGDGELNEGSNWEALLVASARKLGNLVIIVDRNEFQANVKTEELVPLEPLQDKFRAFGARVCAVDGHDPDALEAALRRTREAGEAPFAIIARTVRGKGIPSLEQRADRWFCNFSREEIHRLLEELETGRSADVTSEGLVVR